MKFTIRNKDLDQTTNSMTVQNLNYGIRLIE